MRRRGIAVALAWIAGCGLLPQIAAAQDGFDAFAPVTDRDFTLDLFQGPVLGSTRLLGMGGAGVALAQGAEGMLWNPAAVSVRPANSKDTWDWDWNFDLLRPTLGDDFDNNGIPSAEEGGTELFLLGAVIQYREWGLGITGGTRTFFSERIDPAMPDAAPETFELDFATGHVQLSRSFFAEQLDVGVGVRVATFELRDGPQSSLISITGSNLTAGALWRPADRDLRVGGGVALPVHSNDVIPTECDDPMDCEGFVLPEAVELPWEINAGFAWRRAESRWNQKIDTEWRDEKQLILSADVLLTGAVDNGFGVEAYVNDRLQPSGRDVVFSWRGGAEYEWVPGRFRIRGGTYFEPSRFEGVPGRLHLTLGFDVRVWSFHFWGDPYRLRLSLTGDGAENYGNGALSIGFWH